MEVIRGANNSPVSTEKLIESLSGIIQGDAFLYVGYPLIGFDASNSIDAILIAKQFGIFAFDIMEGTNHENREDFRDKIYNTLQSRFIENPRLSRKRGQLLANINIATYAPAWRHNTNDAEVLCASSDLHSYINTSKNELADDTFRAFIASIQSITEIHRKVNRKSTRDNSKAYYLTLAEQSIANLDSDQSKAVIETSPGIQRIRGLAGSGKTIVLALKTAYLHARFPEYEIAVTFFSRALKQQFKSLIYKFCVEQAKREPDFTKIHILQAWGGYRDAGVYHKYCIENDITFYSVDKAKVKFGNTQALFGQVCTEARNEFLNRNNQANPKEIFDAILVDEAQDFSNEFLQICYDLIRSHDSSNKFNKMLIYAYDELQKINETERLGNPREIFGESIDFENLPNKPKQDVILRVCYRNTRNSLVTAHALGFGVNRRNGLVTMYKDTSIWKDVGYRSRPEPIEYGKPVVMVRTENSSPDFLSSYLPDQSDIITFEVFEEDISQAECLARRIIENITTDELLHRDIIIIDPSPFEYQKNTAKLRSILAAANLRTHIAGVTSSPDEFFIENSIVFTSIFRAKGNEAPMVYIMNAHYCCEGPELIKKRNTLFTAITRSKGWVRVSGIGESMQKLKDEFELIAQNKFRMSFTYPTTTQMDELNLIHGDLSKEEYTEIIFAERILHDIASGKFDKRKLSPELRRILKDL